MNAKHQTEEVQMTEQFEAGEQTSEISIPSPNSTTSFKSAESAGFVADTTVMKTASGSWQYTSNSSQPNSNQQSATDDTSTGFVADTTVVKTAKRTWAHQPSSAKQGIIFTEKSVDASNKAKTQKQLDGAIALAWSRVKTRRRPPALTPTRWVWRLAGSYHLCQPTQQLMETAAWRFASAGRMVLAGWAAQKASEEAGHDRLALLDIQSMGYKAEAVVKELVPPAAVNLVDYFTRSVQARDPIGCAGYSYTMERLAMGIKEDYIQRVEALLPPNTHATRCLRVHSGVGNDVGHVDETVEMMTELTSDERVQVARACYETALLCFSPPSEDYISEEELAHVLKGLEQASTDEI
ncbi:hypothetical protein [Scytonema millei]|uniref:hypothetical protein n=1 Tax=Scytonema millei TaxID=1245922 RepID=UPI002574363D|nr:hypothetical protein [Scytonema millei]